MPISITITANNAAEAAQLVHDLADTISRMSPADIPEHTEVSTVDHSPTKLTEVKAKTTEEPPAAETGPVTDIAESEADVDVDAADVRIPTDVELREIARKIGQTPKGKAAIKQLLGKYSVPNITAVPNDKRVAFKRDLEALAL